MAEYASSEFDNLQFFTYLFVEVQIFFTFGDD